VNQNSTWYGTAKIVNEQLLNTLYAQHKLCGTALRYFNIYGPRMATQGHTEVLVKWFQALEGGKSVRIFGDGTQTMDWVDVRDVAKANVLAVQSTLEQGVFNVGTGRETSLHDLARLVLKHWGRPGEPELVTTQSPTNSIPRRCADTTAAREKLGFEPRFSLDTGLSDMLRWWKDTARPR
jgi:UDP-glucose 4-epimerase